jgi:hypothetical protein
MNTKDGFELGERLFGVYLLFQSMTHAVAIFNIATENYYPSKETSTGYAIYAIVHLFAGLGLLFRPEFLANLVYPKTILKDGDKGSIP